MGRVIREVQLTAFRISNGALQTKDLPKRIKLLNWGRNETVKGPIIVNEFTAATMPAVQANRGWDRVALDYEHNTVPGSETFKVQNEPRKVAAYGVPLLIPGEGLFLDDLQYTPSGMEFSREYCDLSPAPLLNARREVECLHSVALCRAGAVVDLSFFSVAEAVTADKQNQENNMNELMAFLKKVFRLPDTATDDDVMKAFQGAVSMEADGGPVPCSARILALEAAMVPLAALVASDGKITTLSAGLDGIKSKIGDVDVQGKLTALSSTVEGVQKDVMCFMARVSGKVVPLSAEDLAKTSIETLAGMIEKLTVTVPVGQLTPLTAAGAGQEVVAIAEGDAKVAKACGLDPVKVFGK